MLVAEPPLHLTSHFSVSPAGRPAVLTLMRKLPMPAVNHTETQYVMEVTWNRVWSKPVYAWTSERDQSFGPVKSAF